MKSSIKSALNYRFSGRAIFLLVAILCGVLFIPSIRSLATWATNRHVAFEDGSIALPTRWISGGGGHLLSIKRLGATILFPSESIITIDPFAERWPADKIEKVSDFWMSVNGPPVFAGRFKEPLTGSAIAFPSEIKCVSPDVDVRLEYVRIYCLSTDSVHSFEFFGKRDAIAAFARVSSEALQIIRRHPGSIFRD
jgi:hypothetical protein